MLAWINYHIFIVTYYKIFSYEISKSFLKRMSHDVTLWKLGMQRIRFSLRREWRRAARFIIARYMSCASRGMNINKNINKTITRKQYQLAG